MLCPISILKDNHFIAASTGSNLRHVSQTKQSLVNNKKEKKTNKKQTDKTNKERK